MRIQFYLCLFFLVFHLLLYHIQLRFKIIQCILLYNWAWILKIYSNHQITIIFGVMSLASKLKKGTKLKITAKGEYNGLTGLVRYLGPIQGKEAEGDYVGLELEKAAGKNNGTHQGKQYFKCKPNFGMFLKPTSLALMDGTPVVPPAAKGASNKLSKDLQEAQKVEKAQKAKEPEPQVQAPPAKVEKEEKHQKQAAHETTDAKGDMQEMKKKVKALEQENRVLRMQNEKIKFSVKDKDEGKQNELKQQIQFYKGQKQAFEKQKTDLKKKNAQLHAELEEYAENMGMVDTLTIKIETLQSKNQKLKIELETTKNQLKNYQMSEQNTGKNETQLTQNLKILTQTVTYLESDLNEMTDKATKLEQQLKKKEAIETDYKKLERKLKQKEQEVTNMANQLELMSDSVNFVQKITLNSLKKDEELKEATLKLSEYLVKYEGLENQLAINKQFTDELNQELFHQQELMDTYSKQIEDKNKHIMELNRQIEKYKKKIFELTQSNESSIMISSQISEEKEDVSVSKLFFGGDQYQNKYYNILKVNNQIRKSQLKYLIQFSEVRNQVGVYMLNLAQALPESFTSKLYPQVITILTSVKSANDKLYYIFTTIADTFKNKPDIYNKENQELAEWLIVLLKEVITLYGCIQKVQFTLTIAENEEQISEVLVYRNLKDEVRKVNHFALEILQRFVDDNISASVDLQPFISSIESFDEINIGLKRHFNLQYETKMNLCSVAMETVSNILEAIMKYKHTNQLGENGEVDNSLELFTKTVLTYVKQCCMNPYIRYKAEMRQYLDGLNLISNILGDIGVEGNYHELNSLYSETQNIKMLRQTILTTQYHANALENDLKDIVYTSEVSKIQTQLTGKFWQDRIKQIKDELNNVKKVSEEKAELQANLSQAKKKNLILERDLKDKQSTKELYEKRIGELQLKAEQVTTIQNENKRQSQKLKSYQDANKIIEEEIINLTKKNKLVQQENKKLKQKYDTLQTEIMMRNKKQSALTSMSTEDVASLTIFKNVMKQSNQLRTIDIKKKMMQLKQSPIFNLKQNKKAEDQSQVVVARTKALDQISKFTITNPFSNKKNGNEACLDSILLEIDKLKQAKNDAPLPENKLVKVGVLSIASLTKRTAQLNGQGLSIVVN